MDEAKKRRRRDIRDALEVYLLLVATIVGGAAVWWLLEYVIRWLERG